MSVAAVTAAAKADPIARGRIDWGAALAGPAGDALVARGIIDPADREAAIDGARRWQADATEVLLSIHPLSADSVARAYADGLMLERADLAALPPEPDLMNRRALPLYHRHLLLPWRLDGDLVVVACVTPGVDNLALAEELCGRPAILAVATRAGLLAALAGAFAGELTHEAASLLARMEPEGSAITPMPRGQRLAFLGLGLALAGSLALAPMAALVAVNGIVSLFYLANLLLRTVLVGAGLTRRSASPPALDDDVLPRYTVMVPLFQEPDILPILADALDRLDYPRPLLDIKLLLEADDGATIAAAYDLCLADRFELVLVPPSPPRTKPKACNFALPLARGTCLVIFDAEDKPETDQLRKAAAAFAAGPPTLACVQARLNFDNADENWLTRMFALDYALWFDFLLPGLERLGMPIPLGGTSNHFRTDALRHVLAWDPHNVTEDADLGMRLRRKGHQVGTIDSTTFEEANCALPNWVKQRSRWLKGYMQTWLVQMRRPISLWRRLGTVGFIGFQCFVGGTVLSSLLNPVVWAACALWLATGTHWLDELFPPLILASSLFAWLVGNFVFLYLAILAPLRRQWHGLAPWALTATAYWALISIAGYRALWQMIRGQLHWEKTRHGISRYSRAALAAHAARMRQGPP